MKRAMIAYLGSPGSFTHTAAQKYFGTDNVFSGLKNMPDIVERIAENAFSFGIIPVENSITGSIMEAYDLIIRKEIHIAGEIYLKVHQHLMALNNSSLTSIRKCLTHEQGILQCRKFFLKHKKISTEITTDTATAGKKVSSSNDRSLCAVAGRNTAKIYNLKILKENIEDNTGNFTKFAVLSDKIPDKGNKMTLVFTVRHRPGSLVTALFPYKKYGLNLMKIESRPIHGKPFEYKFLMDLEYTDPDVLKKTLSEMKKYTEYLKIAGIYMKGKTYET